MPIPIIFNYIAIHNVHKAGGLISCVPALTHTSRLYVIRNTQANNFRYYIGTANNINHRFTERLRAVREFGFRNNDIANISIAIVRILVNGLPAPPHNTGISAGIDVEKLLIRMYMNQGHGVRNIVKTTPFVNVHGDILNCNFFNPAGWGHFVPAHTNIANGAIY